MGGADWARPKERGGWLSPSSPFRLFPVPYERKRSGGEGGLWCADLPRPTPVRSAVGLLLVGMWRRDGVSSLGGRQSIGHLLFLSATCMTACYTVAIRHARIDGLHAVAIAAVVSLLVYLPVYLAFFENGLFNVPLADLAFQALYQGVLTAAVSLALYGRAIRLLGASHAAAFIALGPIMAALMAGPALGEWPSDVAWVVIMIITTGVYLASGGPLPIWLRPSAQSS